MSAPNPARGEAALGERKLVVDFNGFCTLEAALGAKVPDILKMMDAGLSFTQLRTFVRVFLHAEISDEDAGVLIEEIGLTETLLAVTTAVAGFFKPKETEARPRKAA